MPGTSSDIDARAQTGFAKADAYDRHRPTYPAASVQLLLEQCRVDGLKHGKIVDLASGTGKFTEALAAREEEFDIIAIEPHDDMRRVLDAKQYPRVTVRSGNAASTGLPDESVDAIFVAQAFHWFANMDSLKELHRVLKPHGMLGLIWNIEDYNAPRDHKASSEWEQKLHDLIWTFDDDGPRYRHERWRDVFDGQLKSNPLSITVAADPLFSLPLAEHEELWEISLPKDEVWDRFNTLSQIATLEGEDRERTHNIFLDAVNDPAVQCNAQGEVAVHGRTITVWTSKIPADGRSTLTGVERAAPQ